MLCTPGFGVPGHIGAGTAGGDRQIVKNGGGEVVGEDGRSVRYAGMVHLRT
jgi:hypothetical protein